MKRKFSILFILVLAVLLMMVLAVPVGATWKEGGSTDWYYVDASYGDYHNSVPLVIELDGDSSPGQTFYVGDTITISGDLYAVAQSCAGDGNGAYTEWLLAVNGPSGSDSDSGWNYDSSSGCAVADVDKTLSITYTLTATGTHTVYMSSYAAVAQYWTDVADDYVAASLTFEVAVGVDIDIKPGSDPNSVNLGSNGVVPVAILGSADFDASTVDPLTIVLGGASVRIKGKSGNAGSLEDVNGDGYLDLVVQVLTSDFAPGDGTAELTGATYGGTPIHGTDSIRIVPE